MNLPRKEELDTLQRAFRNLADNPSFRVIAEWVKKERDVMDETNRLPGHENKVSGAYALSVYLRMCDQGR